MMRFEFFRVITISALTTLVLISQPSLVSSDSLSGAPQRSSNPMTLAAGFPVSLSDSYIYEAHTTLADINGDGTLEIIIGGRTQNPDGSLGCSGKVYVYKADATLMWSATVRADINASIAVGDLNGDGYKDLVVGMGAWNADGETYLNECGQGNPSAPGNGGVVALNGQNGSVLWTFNTQDWGEWGTGPNGVLDGVYSSPAIGDINGDGQPEVVFGSWDNCIYLLDKNGNPLWGEIPFTTTQGFCGRHGFFAHDTVWSSPVLADLDGDGKPEIIIGGDISCQILNDPNFCNRYNVPNGGFLWVIRYDGTVLARRWFDQAIQSSPAVADLNNNGVLDIVVGTGRGFPGTGYYVTAMHYQANQDVTLALPTNWQTTVLGRVFSSPAIGDLNNDGVKDVVVIGYYGDSGGTPSPIGPGANQGSYVYALRGDTGSLLWQTHACNNDSIGRSFPIASSPVLANIAGDSRPEVLFPLAWEIEALNPDGTYYTHVNTTNGCTSTSGSATFPGTGTFWPSVAVGDLTGNGTPEIVAPGWRNEGNGRHDGDLYVWSMPAVTANYPWPMFHQNARHTGIAGPILHSSPPAVNAFYRSGSGVNPTFSLNLANIGEIGTINWGATKPPTITLASSGTVTSTASINGSISAGGYSKGTYLLGTIVITGTAGGQTVPGSPQNIPLTLHVGTPVFFPLIVR